MWTIHDRTLCMNNDIVIEWQVCVVTTFSIVSHILRPIQREYACVCVWVSASVHFYVCDQLVNSKMKAFVFIRIYAAYCFCTYFYVCCVCVFELYMWENSCKPIASSDSLTKVCWRFCQEYKQPEARNPDINYKDYSFSVYFPVGRSSQPYITCLMIIFLFILNDS